MYVVLKKETHDLPILISTKNLSYNDYLMADYVEIFSGTLHECQDVIDTLFDDIFSD